MLTQLRSLALVLILISLGACDRRPALRSEVTGNVTFEFNIGDDTKTVVVTDVSDGSTVESIMQRIGDVPIVIRGNGSMAFVEQIGEQSTSQSEGWTYRVNAERVNVGIGVYELHPPAVVTWEFGSGEE